MEPRRHLGEATWPQSRCKLLISQALSALSSTDECFALDQCARPLRDRLYFDRSKEDVMEEAEIERVAARVVEKMMEPGNLHILSRAIAEELRLLGVRYNFEMARLGERLDASYY